MELTNTIQVQKRVVYSFSMMLGDVGGMADFLSIFAAIILRRFSKRFLDSAIAEKLFYEQKGLDPQ